MARINTDTKWSKYASNKQIGSKQYIYAGWPMLTFEWMSFKEKEVFVILDKNHDCPYVRIRKQFASTHCTYGNNLLAHTAHVEAIC